MYSVTSRTPIYTVTSSTLLNTITSSTLMYTVTNSTLLNTIASSTLMYTITSRTTYTVRLYVLLLQMAGGCWTVEPDWVGQGRKANTNSIKHQPNLQLSSLTQK